MPMNRVRFQRGLSMPQFNERYGTQAAHSHGRGRQ